LMTARYETLTLDDVVRFPRPGQAIPVRVGFTPDSSAVTYLHSAQADLVLSLFAFDIADGEARVLAGPPPASTDETGLSRDEELRRERARMRELGVTGYQFARAAEQQTLLVPSGGSLRVSIAGADLQE